MKFQELRTEKQPETMEKNKVEFSVIDSTFICDIDSGFPCALSSNHLLLLLLLLVVGGGEVAVAFSVQAVGSLFSELMQANAYI